MTTLLSGKVLVLTVGTGNMDDLERSLLEPLAKSVRAGEWDIAVLLPSTITEKFAQRLAKRFPGTPFRLETLPETDMENNADACFGHFDRVIGSLLEEGYSATSISVDFTRGTKAMSAALVLAAVRRDVPHLRYMWGSKRDERGMVVSGTEQIAEFPTALATGRRRLDDAESLMRHGDFAAVLELLPDPSDPSDPLSGHWPEDMRDEAAALRHRAGFYAAWDRLDYAEAARLAGRVADEGEAVAWVKLLADSPQSCDHQRMARWLRAVACDLLANGRRRIRDRHFEDALLRAYRILELAGQFLLFDLKIDSASIDPEDKDVKELRCRLHKKGRQDFGKDPRSGQLRASRELSARLLKQKAGCLFKQKAAGLPEQEAAYLLKKKYELLAQKLLNFDRGRDEVAARKRNHSILIHGFEAVAPSEPRPLEKMFDDLEQLLWDAIPLKAKELEAGEFLAALKRYSIGIQKAGQRMPA